MTYDGTITDAMLRAGMDAMKPDRIQGFSTYDRKSGEWGAPHYIRDVFLDPGKQEIWRGDDEDEFHERCKMERFKLGLVAALGELGSRSNGK